MNKTFTFYGIERSKDYFIGLITLGITTIALISLLSLHFKYMHYIGVYMMLFLLLTIIFGWFISLLVIYAWLYKLNVEYWEISYDRNNLSISSDKRDKITIPLTELTKIQLVKEVVPVGQSHAIRFESAHCNLRIDVRSFIMNFSIYRKKDLRIFYKFYQSLVRDIIQHDYIIAASRSQKIIRTSNRGTYRTPASILFVRAGVSRELNDQ